MTQVTDRQTDREKDDWMDRETDSQKDRRTDRQTDRQMQVMHATKRLVNCLHKSHRHCAALHACVRAEVPSLEVSTSETG